MHHRSNLQLLAMECIGCNGATQAPCYDHLLYLWPHTHTHHCVVTNNRFWKKWLPTETSSTACRIISLYSPFIDCTIWALYNCNCCLAFLALSRLVVAFSISFLCDKHSTCIISSFYVHLLVHLLLWSYMDAVTTESNEKITPTTIVIICMCNNFQPVLAHFIDYIKYMY